MALIHLMHRRKWSSLQLPIVINSSMSSSTSPSSLSSSTSPSSWSSLSSALSSLSSSSLHSHSRLCYLWLLSLSSVNAILPREITWKGAVQQSSQLYTISVSCISHSDFWDRYKGQTSSALIRKCRTYQTTGTSLVIPDIFVKTIPIQFQLYLLEA